MTIRIARFVLAIVVAIMVVTPLMPRVALSHERPTIHYDIGTFSYYVEDVENGEVTLDAETFTLLEFIINLNDSQAALLQQALDLSDDRDALVAFLIANGPAMIEIASMLPTSALLQTSQVSGQDPGSEDQRQLLDIEECGGFSLSSDWWECFLRELVVEPLTGVVNTAIDGVATTVNTVLTGVNQLVNDITLFVQDLADKVSQFGQDVMNFFNDATDAAFGWIGEIRTRYLAWFGNNCDGASACGQFRANLQLYFSGVLGLEASIAALIGPVSFRLPGIANDQAAIVAAANAIPSFLLWPLAEVLELLPLNWWEIPSRVGAMLPDIGPNAMTPWEIIDDAVSSGGSFDLCSHISADGTAHISPLPHANIDVYAMSLLTSGLSIAEGYIPDDLTIDVLGEGTTVMAHPVKVLFTGLNQFVDLVATAMGQVNDLDTTCATEAFREAIIAQLGGIESAIAAQGGDQLSLYIEDHLTTCTVIVTLYLPAANGGQLEVVRDLVDELIQQVEGAGFNAANARALHNQGLADMSAGEYRRAYLDFCASYRSLRFGGAGSVSYSGTGEVWACVSMYTGQMRRVNRDPLLEPGDPDYYTPPVEECQSHERLVEVYGYDVSASGGGGRS